MEDAGALKRHDFACGDQLGDARAQPNANAAGTQHWYQCEWLYSYHYAARVLAELDHCPPHYNSSQSCEAPILQTFHQYYQHHHQYYKHHHQYVCDTIISSIPTP